MTFACGGRGPCCHVGYAHRHCEHCDIVIPTYPYYQQPYSYYPWGVRYGNGTVDPLANPSAGTPLASQLQALNIGHLHDADAEV